MYAIGLFILLSNSATFVTANNLYNSGQYEVSANEYETLIDKGIRNHKLYYNLGNCYFKLGRLGEAIYFYKKAQKLAPGDRDINFNLNFARSRRTDTIKIHQYPQFISLIMNFLNSLSINLMSIIATILYFSLVLIISIVIIYKKHLLGYSFKIWLSSVLLVVLIVLGVNIKRVNSQEGVIVDSISEVRSGPSEEYTLVFTIHDGTELKILESQNGWLRINLPDGLEGWLPASRVRKI